MNERHFHLRLDATYVDSENKVDELNLEVLHDQEWEAVELGIRSPGFFMYINALLTCQHLYMRTNCAERDLVLASAHGELRVETSENWEIKQVTVSFDSKLKSGTPSQVDLNYITERMRHCPVSTNLPAHVKMDINVNLE